MTSPESKSTTGPPSPLTTAETILSGGGPKSGLARLWPFLGPAFIASIAYVDPGNFATNIQGGAQFGYRLLWKADT